MNYDAEALSLFLVLVAIGLRAFWQIHVRGRR